MKNLLLLIIAAALSSCYYDNIEELHPNFNTTCDTTNVAMSYARDIIPILSSSCGTTDQACHASASSESLIGLDTYTGVAEQAANGDLLKSIVHDPSVEPMPKGGGKLDDCSILKIESWINHGYPNN